MCGIAGILNLRQSEPSPIDVLVQMIGSLEHRGPDESGIYRDAHVGMASTRLSIVDVAQGQQPLSNEDGTLWIVFNGEIFNYPDLRRELEGHGHRFATHCDTEVILHAYEQWGPTCLDQLNGQWALAIWDADRRELFLARDRMGIRPLFYTMDQDRLIFASEIKAIRQAPGVKLAIDRQALAQTLSYWAPIPPRTAFENVHQILPAHYLRVKDGQITEGRYWEVDFTEDPSVSDENEALESFRELLQDSTKIRLQADVPVGAYLSGGIDSSLTAALAMHSGAAHLHTFSIGFEDSEFDESLYQRRMVEWLGAVHHQVSCTDRDIGESLPDVIYHTEAPILRTAPVPMFLLSRLVHAQDHKVVLTGEGADEVLAGYGIFKEMQVRRFWAKNPQSTIRPLLLQRVYPNIPRLAESPAFLNAFYRRGLSETSSPYYSHLIRWGNTARLRRLLSVDGGGDLADELERLFPMPAEWAHWSQLGVAQYLEMTSFLSPYLLSSQGDRVSMAHSVEGRYPFLDHRIVEFCGRLPTSMKLRGMREKWLLKRLGRSLLPEEIWSRVKKPYRAPIRSVLFPGGYGLDYVEEMSEPRQIEQTGYFNPLSVAKLFDKARSRSELSEVDEMAIIGVISTQLLDQKFVKEPGLSGPIRQPEKFKLVDRLVEA